MCSHYCGIYWITIDEWQDEQGNEYILEYAYCNCCDAYQDDRIVEL